jgi:catechol 2,3-dioxygenase-like lactoylglutathione lyase family enzyme
MIPQRVSLITIGARDFTLLRDFYNRLGWSEIEYGYATYAVFKTVGVLLSLYPYEELAKDAGVEISEANDNFNGVTFAICVDEREQVDSAIEMVRQAGGKIIREPSDAFWGGRTSYFADPENNLWELAWNPDAKFDDRGATLSI